MEKQLGLTKEMILDIIRDLACSQGFYGGLLLDICDDPTILDYFEEQHFQHDLDFITWLEGGI